MVTYGPGGRFTMTDRGRPALRQSQDALEIGPSAMRWNGHQLVIEVDEVSSFPVISRVRGTITLTPQAITDQEVALHPRHIWRPFAPIAQIEVNLTQGHQWQGHGYFDANFGTAALEADFDRWTWGRFPLRDRAVCFYDATRRDGSTLALGVEVSPDGSLREITPPPLTSFARTKWQVARDTRADAGFAPRQKMAMLDAPFYSRSVVETRIDGEISHGVHEALDLKRFRNPVLKFMLATRVPRCRSWQDQR